MALIDIVKYQADDNFFAWKFPSEDLRIGTQVIVNVSQFAFFVKGGRVFDEFNSGTHTLTTYNIPLLNEVINIPFGGESPFQAEVWYVNLVAKLDNKWGTSSPILLEDPKYGIVIPIRAYGQYGFKISNPRLFLEKLVGNQIDFSANKIQDYFKGKIISTLTKVVSQKLISDNTSILEINIHLDELSKLCEEQITLEFQEYGIEFNNFYFLSINVPENDPSIVRLKEAKDLTAKVKITGRELYQMDRSFDVLEEAAKNESGIAGGLMSAGIGLGAGLNIGNQMNGVSSHLSTNLTPPPIPILYYAIINNGQFGPGDYNQIKKFIVSGEIISTTLIWKQGLENWQPIDQFDEFINLFNTEK